MGSLQLLSAIGFPVMMAIGAIAAWRMSKKEHDPRPGQDTWRDDSLDQWRRERDLMAEQARTARDPADPSEHLSGGQEETIETKRHQRIGG